jgi:hypothetical protein
MTVLVHVHGDPPQCRCCRRMAGFDVERVGLRSALIFTILFLHLTSRGHLNEFLADPVPRTRFRAARDPDRPHHPIISEILEAEGTTGQFHSITRHRARSVSRRPSTPCTQAARFLFSAPTSSRPDLQEYGLAQPCCVPHRPGVEWRLWWRHMTLHRRSRDDRARAGGGGPRRIFRAAPSSAVDEGPRGRRAARPRSQRW